MFLPEAGVEDIFAVGNKESQRQTVLQAVELAALGGGNLYGDRIFENSVQPA